MEGETDAKIDIAHVWMGKRDSFVFAVWRRDDDCCNHVFAGFGVGISGFLLFILDLNRVYLLTKNTRFRVWLVFWVGGAAFSVCAFVFIPFVVFGIS